jgi:hypothetical protein
MTAVSLSYFTALFFSPPLFYLLLPPTQPLPQGPKKVISRGEGSVGKKTIYLPDSSWLMKGIR